MSQAVADNKTNEPGKGIAGSREDDAVVVSRQGDALWVALNKPEAMNALSPATIEALDAALEKAEADPEIRALVITGNDRFFCAGADLKSVAAMNENDEQAALDTFLTRVGEVFCRLEQLGIPTIAAINGITLAGGLELALCCDVIVAANDVRIGDGHAKYGQIPGGGATLRLPRRIGQSRAKYLMFSGEILSASEALDCGLVDFVAGDAGLTDHVEELLVKYADKSPLVLRGMKRLARESQELTASETLRAEIDACLEHAKTFDRNEGLAAFAEKRVPQYRGR